MNKKHIVLNGTIIWFEIVFTLVSALAVYIVVSMPSDPLEDTVAGYIVLIILVSLLIISIVFAPHYCVLDDAGISIRYLFGRKEEAEWRQIRRIYTELDMTLGSRPLRRTYHYRFIGMTDNKAFYKEGVFPKTKRLEKLLLQYSEKKIVPYGGNPPAERVHVHRKRKK